MLFMMNNTFLDTTAIYYISPLILSNKLNLKKFFIFISFIIYILQTTLVECSNSSMTVGQAHILLDDMLRDMNPEQVEALRNDLQHLANMANNQEEITNNIIAIESRFGWESLGLFIILTITGYTVIRYGSDIFNFVTSTITDMIKSSQDALFNISRESVRRMGHNMLDNPNTQRVVIQHFEALIRTRNP